MSGRELSTGLLASTDMSKLSSSVAPSSRAVGHSQVCVLLILGVGFLLIISYQSEIHVRDIRRHAYSSLVPTASSSSESLAKKTILNELEKSDAKSTARLQSGNNEKGAAVVGAGKLEIENSSAERRLESQSTNSSTENPSPPRPTKKIDWKDIKIEAFQPLVDNAHSNIVGSRFQLVIKVLALNDNASLARCLNSLSKAEYAGDQVDIHIYIDHFEVSEFEGRRRLLAEEGTEAEEDVDSAKEVTEQTTASNTKSEKTKKRKKSKRSKSSSSASSNSLPEPSSYYESKPPRLPDRVSTGVDSVNPGDWRLVEERLTEARKVLSQAESFPWKHGKKVIHYRTTTAGSQSQWLDAWWPSSDNEFALFVEDDAEVSPLYYRYARSLIATYYYQWSQFDNLLYGISLQRPQIVPGKNGRPLKVDDRTRLFKYQMIGIWGQIFFPGPWKEFREWYDSKKSHDVQPLVDGMVTTDWYQEHGEKMFTPWFVKFAYSRGYFNLYTNFLRDRVLSVTHRDVGAKPAKYAGCDSVLLWENGTYDLDIWHMAPNWHIKRYDYCFKEVRVGRFANYSADVASVLESVAKENKEILMVSTMGVPGVLVSNFLCIVRKLGIENYVLVGEDPVLLEDLARRGHATVRFENKNNLKENIEKEASALADTLELGYSLWFARADTVWVGNPMAHANTSGGADVIGVENSQLNLFFIRSTEKTILLWGTLNKHLINAPVDMPRVAKWEMARENFMKTCQEEEEVQMRTLDEVVFIDGENLFALPPLDGGESADAPQIVGQVVVLSGLKSLENYEIEAKVRQLDSWNLNDDLVCASLTC